MRYEADASEMDFNINQNTCYASFREKCIRRRRNWIITEYRIRVERGK